jgi:hypothetical protein
MARGARRATSPFGGAAAPVEPLVGEIVGLRTFRVDESGLLLPLYAQRPWYDGANTATCAPPTGEHERTDHAVADPGCECGFYAYGTEDAASRNRHMRYVQAVVSCWGNVVAGTQGVRAQHARIDAVWFAPGLSVAVRQRVAATYPSARLYRDRDAMLAEHPLSRLPCYAPAPRPSTAPRAAAVAAGLSLIGIGLLPGSLLTGVVLVAWAAVVAAVAACVLWLLLGHRGTGHVAAAVVAASVLAWLVAPAFGLAGWVLRVPLLRALLVATGSYLVTLRPRYFPIVRTVRPKTFCGVA